MGSSPRVRGKVTEMVTSQPVWGIIPAGAGKSIATYQLFSFKRDHPRGCGEKFRAYALIWNQWGSSPRVRGKECLPAGREFGIRIIPAGAGKSMYGPAGPRILGDHPRGCGEKV